MYDHFARFVREELSTRIVEYGLVLALTMVVIGGAVRAIEMRPAASLDFASTTSIPYKAPSWVMTSDVAGGSAASARTMR